MTLVDRVRDRWTARGGRGAAAEASAAEASAAEASAAEASAAADKAETSAEAAVQAEAEARQAAEEAAAAVDNAVDLVVDGSAAIVDHPAVRRDREPPPLLRHSPFTMGFLGATGAAVAIFLLQQLIGISSVLILIVMALFLAVGLNPLAEWFMRRGIRRGFAVTIVLVLVVALLTLFVAPPAPVISEQIARITLNAPGWFDDLQNNPTVQDLDQRFDIIERARDYATSGGLGESLFGGALGVGLAVLSAVANSLIVLVLTVYFLASLPSIKHAGYRLAPASNRARVSELGDRIIRSTGAYVSGAFLVSVCAGVSTLVFTMLVGLGDYSFALAFIVGLLSLIPIVGAVISGFLITLLALTVSPTVALISLIYYVAYQQFESYVIYPRIMKRAVDIPGAVTVIAALVGGALMGVIGAVLAVPVAAALLLLHREVFLRRQDAR